MRKWGRREDVEKGKYRTIKRLFGDQFDWVQLCTVGWYWLLIIIIVVTLVNVAFCIMIGPIDDGTTTDIILIICICDWHHGYHHHHHLLDVIGCGILCDCVSRRWWCYSAEQMVTARAQRNLSNGRCNGQNMNKQANKILGQIWWNLTVLKKRDNISGCCSKVHLLLNFSKSIPTRLPPISETWW